jgi:hypothetical protein
VVDEIADIRAPEIHAHSDAGIASRSGPIRHLDHIKELSVGRVPLFVFCHRHDATPARGPVTR